MDVLLRDVLLLEEADDLVDREAAEALPEEEAVFLLVPEEEADFPDPEREEALLPEEVFRFAEVDLAEAFFVVLGLLFCVGFLEAFLAVEDVPLCAIMISPSYTILSIESQSMPAYADRFIAESVSVVSRSVQPAMLRSNPLRDS